MAPKYHNLCNHLLIYGHSLSLSLPVPTRNNATRNILIDIFLWRILWHLKDLKDVRLLKKNFFNPQLTTFFHCFLEGKGERETCIGCFLYASGPGIVRAQTGEWTLRLWEDAPNSWVTLVRADVRLLLRDALTMHISTSSVWKSPFSWVLWKWEGYRLDNAIYHSFLEQHFSMYFKKYFKKDLIYLCFRGRGGEGEREGENIDVWEKHRSVASCMHPNPGPGPQPRHVSWPGIQLTTFCPLGWRPTHRATRGMASRMFQVQNFCWLWWLAGVPWIHNAACKNTHRHRMDLLRNVWKQGAYCRRGLSLHFESFMGSLMAPYFQIILSMRIEDCSLKCWIWLAS